MLRLRLTALFLAASAVAVAQDGGMIPRWQVEELAEGVVRNVDTAKKVVSALRPAEWIQDGAPAAYVDQHKILLDEIDQLSLSAQALGREPERLRYAVDTFLWLDRTDMLLGSVSAGARRYYNGKVADLLDSARSRNVDGIATIKEYIRQLAIYVESSMEVAHAEAQRCRESLATQPLR